MSPCLVAAYTPFLGSLTTPWTEDMLMIRPHPAKNNTNIFCSAKVLNLKIVDITPTIGQSIQNIVEHLVSLKKKK